MRSRRRDLETRLAEAEARVAAGKQYIATQRAITTGLANIGSDARAAWELLVHLEKAQEILIAYRDRVECELDGMG